MSVDNKATDINYQLFLLLLKYKLKKMIDKNSRNYNITRFLSEIISIVDENLSRKIILLEKRISLK
jgi:hypothetical protein